MKILKKWRILSEFQESIKFDFSVHFCMKEMVKTGNIVEDGGDRGSGGVVRKSEDGSTGGGAIGDQK